MVAILLLCSCKLAVSIITVFLGAYPAHRNTPVAFARYVIPFSPTVYINISYPPPRTKPPMVRVPTDPEMREGLPRPSEGVGCSGKGSTSTRVRYHSDHVEGPVGQAKGWRSEEGHGAYAGVYALR